MWSVGVIVYILLGGYAPFEGPVEELAEMIQKGSYEFHDEYWSRISMPAKDLIRSLLQVNPEKRISAERALQCGWMIIDEEMLTDKDLSVAQSAIKKMLPGDKLRGMVKAVSGLRCSLNSLISDYSSKSIASDYCDE
jgi:serine/threonine protein kinase